MKSSPSEHADTFKSGRAMAILYTKIKWDTETDVFFYCPD